MYLYVDKTNIYECTRTHIKIYKNSNNDVNEEKIYFFKNHVKKLLKRRDT